MKLNIKEIVLFSMFGALMFASKILMAWIPNVHILGTMIMTLTIVYRQKALYPLYLYVFADGLFGGFAMWWYPYLYVWTVLWGITMLLPRRMPKWLAPIVYMVVCALHGFTFGILYAPMQAWMFGFDFKMTVAWIVSGFPFDFIHGISNFAVGSLIVPLVEVIRKTDSRFAISERSQKF